jgi:hypothetical protein
VTASTAIAHTASKVLTLKNVLGAALFTGALLLSLISAAKVPAKLDSHMQQTVETNKKLDVLICLQAKLDTPIRCVAKSQ